MTRSFDVRTIASAGCHIAGADHSGEADIRQRSVRRALRFVVGILFLVVSCDESLPPRADPNLVLEGRIEGIYVLAHQDNFLAVHIVVTNTYDETLAAEAVLGGRLAIQSRRDPSIVKIVELSDTLVTSVYPYDPFTSQLTLGPGESLRLTYEWDLVDDRGRDLRNHRPHHLF